jgi:hypothetical protein
MKCVFVACVLGATARHAREVDNVKAATFDRRMLGSRISEKTHACFARHYDASPMTRHPKQKVSAMKPPVTASNDLVADADDRIFGSIAPTCMNAPSWWPIRSLHRSGSSKPFYERSAGTLLRFNYLRRKGHRASTQHPAGRAFRSGAAFAASRAGAATEAARARLKAAYHLNDLGKVIFAIGNIQDHLDGIAGPGHVTIALVVSRSRAARVSFSFRYRAPRRVESDCQALTTSCLHGLVSSLVNAHRVGQQPRDFGGSNRHDWRYHFAGKY